MREKGYFILLGIASIFGWLSVILILFRIDPFVATGAQLALFYISAAIAFYGTFFLMGWGIRRLLIRRMALEYYIEVLFRQTLLATLLLTLLLLLQSVRLLSWWNSTLLVIAFFFLEYFFITYSSQRS